MQDAQDVMSMLVKAQNEQGEMELDDPQVNRKRKLTIIFISPCSGVLHDKFVGSDVQDHWARFCPVPAYCHGATNPGSRSKATGCVC